ncbi:hypothetical protein FKV24_000435 [Lysobacter maris]|uniref:Uncharacterized protein n=1 Tax=Marilutibacter maris TaxID=1605891 RepID=A0A508B6D4_9GAMM|nr:hypothetical protein [Lysobacter maris]KAB8198673.1 hypothetical protein FKV24_000435 [Lysobacter maris]
MKELLERRLETLAAEQQKGRQALAELDEQRAQLARTLLRIEGAMAVLGEMLANQSDASGVRSHDAGVRQVPPAADAAMPSSNGGTP